MSFHVVSHGILWNSHEFSPFEARNGRSLHTLAVLTLASAQRGCDEEPTKGSLSSNASCASHFEAKPKPFTPETSRLAIGNAPKNHDPREAGGKKWRKGVSGDFRFVNHLVHFIFLTKVCVAPFTICSEVGSGLFVKTLPWRRGLEAGGA